MKLTKIVAVVGIALLFAGCTRSTAVSLSQQQKVITQIDGQYYNKPLNSLSTIIKSSHEAKVLSTTSSGLIQCKKDYALITTKAVETKVKTSLKKYGAILTPSERNSLEFQKTDSKEYRNLVKVTTEAARSGQVYCIPPLSKKQVQ